MYSTNREHIRRNDNTVMRDLVFHKAKEKRIGISEDRKIERRFHLKPRGSATIIKDDAGTLPSLPAR